MGIGFGANGADPTSEEEGLCVLTVERLFCLFAGVHCYQDRPGVVHDLFCRRRRRRL